MENQRTEPAAQEWARLYKLSQELSEMKPWEDFADVELVTLEMPDEQRVYVTIMGQGGETYGISFYEGLEGLWDFSLIAGGEQMDIPMEYIMFIQNNLTCYFSDREELSREELQLIRELGLKFRGRNKWPQFVSMKEGYFPYPPDQEEVQRMTVYMEALIGAVTLFRAARPKVDYDASESFVYTWDEASGSGRGKVEALPQERLGWEVPELLDLEVQRLKKAKRTQETIEVDLFFLHAALQDEQAGRPANVRALLIADHRSGMLLDHATALPGEAPRVMMERVLQYILDRGAPARIMTRNPMMASYLEEICEISSIELTQDWSLPAIDEAMDSFLAMSGGSDRW